MEILHTCGDLKIIHTPLLSVYGVTYRGFNDKYLMIINSNISPKAQRETMFHEAYHIANHFGRPGEVTTFEKETKEFTKRVVKNYDEIFNYLKLAN